MFECFDFLFAHHKFYLVGSRYLGMTTKLLNFVWGCMLLENLNYLILRILAMVRAALTLEF